VLELFGTFSFKRKSTERSSVSKIVLYFLCLDAKKVTKKDQGQPETIRAFVHPRHTSYFERSSVSKEDKIKVRRSNLEYQGL